MKKKKRIIMIISILIILLTAFGVFKLISSSKAKEEEAKMKQEEIKKEIFEYYEEFNDLATRFNAQKEELNNSLNDLYYATIPNNNVKIVSILEDYTNVINDMEEISIKLNEICPSETMDSDIERKCASYKISYQNASEIYKEDILAYNNLIEDYNEWTKTQEGYLEISKYEQNIEE